MPKRITINDGLWCQNCSSVIVVKQGAMCPACEQVVSQGASCSMRPRRNWTKIGCWLAIVFLLAIFWIAAFKWIGSRFKVQAASKIGPWVGLRIPVFDNLKKGYWYFKMDPGQFQVTPDPAGTSDGIFSLQPPETPAEPLLIGGSLPNATVGIRYSQSLMASGGVAPYTWDVTEGELPPGLTLSPEGILSGTPTTIGNYTVTVRVTDSGPLVGFTTFTSSPEAEPLPTQGFVAGGIQYLPSGVPPAPDQPFDGGRANEQMLSCSVPVQGVSTCTWR